MLPCHAWLLLLLLFPLGISTLDSCVTTFDLNHDCQDNRILYLEDYLYANTSCWSLKYQTRMELKIGHKLGLHELSCRISVSENTLMTVVEMDTVSNPAVPISMSECLNRQENVFISLVNDYCYAGKFNVSCNVEDLYSCRSDIWQQSHYFTPVHTFGDAFANTSLINVHLGRHSFVRLSFVPYCMDSHNCPLSWTYYHNCGKDDKGPYIHEDFRCDDLPQCPYVYGRENPFSDEPITCHTYQFWRHFGSIIGFLFALIVLATAIYGMLYCLDHSCLGGGERSLTTFVKSPCGAVTLLLLFLTLASVATWCAVEQGEPYLVKDLLVAAAMLLWGSSLLCALKVLEVTRNPPSPADVNGGVVNRGLSVVEVVDEDGRPKSHLPPNYDYPLPSYEEAIRSSPQVEDEIHTRL